MISADVELAAPPTVRDSKVSGRGHEASGRKNISSAKNQFEWLEEMQQGCNIATCPRAMIDCYKSVQELLALKSHVVINNLLLSADVKKMHSVAITGFLRYSASGRKDIPRWNTFLEASRLELSRRGEDVENILWGLHAHNN